MTATTRRIILAVCIALSGLSLANSVRAEIPPDAMKRVDAAISKSVADFTIFMTCTAAMTRTHKFLRGTWKLQRERTVAVLKKAGGSPSQLADFDKRTTYAALMRPNLRVRDLPKFCNSRGDWMKRLQKAQFGELDKRVRNALARK